MQSGSKDKKYSFITVVSVCFFLDVLISLLTKTVFCCERTKQDKENESGKKNETTDKFRCVRRAPIKDPRLRLAGSGNLFFGG